jgi:hypothetical protein
VDKQEEMTSTFVAEFLDMRHVAPYEKHFEQDETCSSPLVSTCASTPAMGPQSEWLTSPFGLPRGSLAFPLELEVDLEESPGSGALLEAAGLEDGSLPPGVQALVELMDQEDLDTGQDLLLLPPLTRGAPPQPLMPCRSQGAVDGCRREYALDKMDEKKPDAAHAKEHGRKAIAVLLRGLPNELLYARMFEAVLQQAGLEGVVQSYRTSQGTPCGHAELVVFDPAAAEWCAQHFQGCQWDASGSEVLVHVGPLVTNDVVASSSDAVDRLPSTLKNTQGRQDSDCHCDTGRSCVAMRHWAPAPPVARPRDTLLSVQASTFEPAPVLGAGAGAKQSSLLSAEAPAFVMPGTVDVRVSAAEVFGTRRLCETEDCCSDNGRRVRGYSEECNRYYPSSWEQLLLISQQSCQQDCVRTTPSGGRQPTWLSA